MSSQQKTVLSQEKKKVKVTGIAHAARQYPYNNSINYVHHIMFEGDNNKWEYHSAKDKVDKFKEGDVIEVEMKIEQRINNGNTYTDYKLRTIDDNKSKGGFSKSEPKDEGVITYLACLDYATTLHAEKGGSHTMAVDDLAIKTANKFFNEAIKHTTLPQPKYKPINL